MRMDIRGSSLACFLVFLCSSYLYGESNGSQGFKKEYWNSKKSAEAIEYAFDQISLKEKKILSIGSDWGTDFYLSDKFGVQIVDFGINQDLVASLNKKTPERLRDLVKFDSGTSYNALNYPDESFDIVFYRMFDFNDFVEISRECSRMLKKNGLFIILDCFAWENNLTDKDKKLYNFEQFSHIIDENQYTKIFKKNNLNVISIRDDSNLGIKSVQRSLEIFNDPKKQMIVSRMFDDKQESIRDGYILMIKALEAGKLKVFRFVTQK
jgi:hypothetical protein